MTVTGRDLWRRSLMVTTAAVVVLTATFARGAGAQDKDDVQREAGKHFQRGVSLYGEADYNGALVEFKRAAELSPNPTVLFNIGQTEYQLRDYASALRTFERYLAEAGPSAEVENAIRVLRSRVGRLTVTTNPPGADVAVDDVPVGKTPFAKPVLVGVGHVKVVATLAGRAAATRYVDVAADDEVPLAIDLSAESPNATPTAPPEAPVPQLEAKPAPVASGPAPTWHAAGWITTGVAASGAIVFGLLARKESDDLKAARDSYPATADNLNHLASRTTTYSVIADSLAAVAVVAAGVTLYSTFTGPAADGHARPSTSVSLGPGSFRLETSF